MVCSRRAWIPVVAGIALALSTGFANAGDDPIDYSRDIRPILSENCFKCHGPDPAAREAKLRLDVFEGAVAARRGGAAVVPGDPDASLILKRLTSTDPSFQMPPPETGKSVTAEQIELLRRWIGEGAKYSEHWSFVTPRRPNLADPKFAPFDVGHPVDTLIAQRLAEVGLSFSEEATRSELIRRVTLDLTGITPSIEEVDAFLADDSPNAYEKLVDRLLASSRYGEHMARYWLDASRYADTHGLHIDAERNLWRWREWVIESFNDNKPYDDFSIEQLAGDLLPNPSLAQRIATGFNRNHVTTGEGGAIAEEYLAKYAIDRVETTATVWMGLTAGCAQCHDHKYDPLTQKEFYELLAFFNNITEAGLDGNRPAPEPNLKAPTPDQSKELERVRDEVAKRRAEMDVVKSKLGPELVEWENELLEDHADESWEAFDAPIDASHPLNEGLIAHFPLDLDARNRVAGEGRAEGRDGYRNGHLAFPLGQMSPAAEFDGKAFVDVGDVAPFEHTDRFSYGAWIYLTGNTVGTPLARMDDGNQFRGYDLYVANGKVAVHIINDWPENCIKVTSNPTLPNFQWHHVFMTYDGSGKAAGVSLYFNGRRVKHTVNYDTLTATIRTEVPLQLGSRKPGSRFKGLVDDVRIYDRALTHEEVIALHRSAGIEWFPLAETVGVTGDPTVEPEPGLTELSLRTALDSVEAIRVDLHPKGKSKDAPIDIAEIEVVAVSVAGNSEERVLKLDAVGIRGATAAGDAADGDLTTSCSIPRGTESSAVLFADEPFGFAGGTELRIRVKSSPDVSWGKLRFSVARAADRSALPASFGVWHSAGPFKAANGKAAHETEFGPEKDVVAENAPGFDAAKSYLDGKVSWKARPQWRDGAIHNLSGANSATYLYRTIDVPRKRKMTLSLGSDDSLKVWVNGSLVLEDKTVHPVAADQRRVTVDLAAGTNHLLLKVVNYGGGYAFYFKPTVTVNDPPLDLVDAVRTPAADRAEGENDRIREYYMENFSPEARALRDQIASLDAEAKKIDSMIPVTMVMQEMTQRKETFVLIRGDYQRKGEKVSPKIPDFLPPLSEDAPRNRLGLAQWLLDPDHPLTSRVVVNRFWQQLFGTGLVATVDDFGSQGEWPSHPELLDWLAREFTESGWDVKRLMKMLVMSKTYRQSSKVTPELLALDPNNRLLGRGPRFRMDAEMVRDSALAMSDLLVERHGGRSVRPYQPPGLWKAVSYGFNVTFVADKGDGLYRRSLYTFWKRTSPPPSLLIFDAPTRETCVVRRARTNTPLQALVLLNDPQYVEAARAMAERVMKAEEKDGQRIIRAFRIATSRTPSDRELEILARALGLQRQRYRDDAESAKKLIAVGDSKADEELDPSELAAWTALMSIIINLDETVTKG